MTIPIDGTIANFETAVTSAAGQAQKGDVLLFVGPGGFRGLTISAFDSTPSSVHGMSLHPNAINSDVLNLPNIATKDSSGKWIANDEISNDAQARVDKLAVRYDALDRLGAVLKRNKVSRFIILTCNIGKVLRLASSWRSSYKPLWPATSIR